MPPLPSTNSVEIPRKATRISVKIVLESDKAALPREVTGEFTTTHEAIKFINQNNK